MEQFVVGCCNMWERGARGLTPLLLHGVSLSVSLNSLLHTEIGILACVTPQDVEGILTAFKDTSCAVLNV